jgi:hypothetical protein
MNAPTTINATKNTKGLQVKTSLKAGGMQSTPVASTGGSPDLSAKLGK